MKYLCILLMTCVACFARAQVSSTAQAASSTSAFPSEAERDQEQERLNQLRQKLEETYKNDLKACYQKFDVNTCRIEARNRRVEANAALRKEEIRFNAVERQIHAEESKQNLLERNSDAKRKQAEADRAAAIAASKDRADANAQKQIDHDLQGTKRGDYERKQRDAAQHRADVEKKQRERNQEPAAPLPVPGR